MVVQQRVVTKTYDDDDDADLSISLFPPSVTVDCKNGHVKEEKSGRILLRDSLLLPAPPPPLFYFPPPPPHYGYERIPSATVLSLFSKVGTVHEAMFLSLSWHAAFFILLPLVQKCQGFCK